MRALRPWHRVPRAAVAVPGSLEMSKARLDKAWSSLGQWKVSLLMAGVEMSWFYASLTQCHRNHYFQESAQTVQRRER